MIENNKENIKIRVEIPLMDDFIKDFIDYLNEKGLITLKDIDKIAFICDKYKMGFLYLKDLYNSGGDIAIKNSFFIKGDDYISAFENHRNNMNNEILELNKKHYHKYLAHKRSEKIEKFLNEN